MKKLAVNLKNSPKTPFLIWRACLSLATPVIGLCVPAISMAQTPPSASTLQQQIERDQQAEKQRLQIKPTPLAQVEAPLAGQTVVVSEFKFKGNTLLSNEELSNALAPLLNRPLDFARLQSSPVVVADLYRSKGWVVETLLPGQDIDKGSVTIEIVEAVFGQTQISGTPATLVSQEAVLRIFRRQQESGQFLNINNVDRALLLADDLPGITVSGALAQGAQAGQTDLVLQLADEPRLTTSMTADNTGAVSTGTNRLLALLNLNSPTSSGDAFNLTAMRSSGSGYARVAYGLPLGSDGWRVGVNASRLDYRLISAAYKDLNASGNSTTTGLELSYPWVRSRSFNLNTSLNADKKAYDNVSGGATTSAYKNIPVSLVLSGSSFDSVGQGGANAFSLGLTSGRLNLNGSPTEASDATTTQAAGMYKKIRYSLSRQQQLSTNVSLYTALSGQQANKNLDSSEKFYLGGSSGVRAYPSSEAGGTLGQMLNLELRWQLPDGWSVTGLYDYGRISVNKQNNFSGAPPLNTYALKGSGLAVGWRGSEGLSLQASYARRIGTNPNPITTDINRGADQDGTLRLNRFWLTASQTF